MSPRFIAWAFLLAAVRAAEAQSPQEVEVGVGVARVQQRARDERQAAVVNATWRSSDPRYAFLVSGALTNTGDRSSAAQIAGGVAWRPDPGSWFVIEGGAGLNMFGVSDVGRGGNVYGVVRPRVLWGPGGAWLSLADGQTLRDLDSSHGTAVEGGAWIQGGGFTASVSSSRLRTDDWPLFEASGIFLNRDAYSYDVDDVMASLRWVNGPFTADVQKTWRVGRRATNAAQQAVLWGASWAVSDRVALALTGGRVLADPVRGTPDATIASATVRLTWRPSRSESDVPGVKSYARLVPQPDGALLFVAVTVPDGVSVDIAGDFSGWEPAPLHRTANGWELEVRLPSGRHRVAVRFDGGAWRSPGNLAKMKDEFGGEYGLIIVP